MKKHKISHPYVNSQKKNKKILFLCSFSSFCSLHSCSSTDDVDPMPKEEKVEAPSPDQMSDEAIRYLQGEDIYQGTLSWQGNKVSTKFNYDMKK